MNETLQLIVRHGYQVLFVWIAAEQLGVPIPALPVLLAAGALAGWGQLSLPVVIVVAVLASLLSDTIWYEIGRRRGVGVLQFLCKIALEPDSCVRNTQKLFGRYGARSILAAKFVPGLNTAAPPMAGIVGMPLWQFLLLSILGGFLYTGTFVGIGFLFKSQLHTLAEGMLRLGERLGVILLALIAAYVAWKYWQRRRTLRDLRVARMTPEELKQKLDRGEEITIVDLRDGLALESEPHSIPGALLLSPDELDSRHAEIPRDRDVVLYCT